MHPSHSTARAPAADPTGGAPPGADPLGSGLLGGNSPGSAPPSSIPPGSTSPGADPLAALRQATASHHQLLDSGLPLSADDASLADYAAHLRMLRAWLAPLEAWLGAYHDGPQGGAGLAPVARLALIDADLAEAGMPAMSSSAAAPAAWPDGANAAWRWGVCYVVEGAQLGGTVLYQRLAARLAPHPLRYLRGDPAGPGPRWRAFMLALRAQVRTPGEIDDACAGACAAFDVILALAGLARA